MELVNSSTGWSCYRPEKAYSTGHLVFISNVNNNVEDNYIDAAKKYGQALVDLGLAISYYLYMYIKGDIVQLHITPIYTEDNHKQMTDFVEFICESYQS